MKPRLKEGTQIDIELLKEKIKLAKESVTNENEPFKTEGFKIILAKLLEQTFPDSSIRATVTSDVAEETPLEQKKAQLAKNCSISVEELNNVLLFKEDSVEILSPILGSETFKHLAASQCTLIAYEIVFGREWITSNELIECLKKMGVKDFSNLAPHLSKRGDIFLSYGSRGHKNYKLTSSSGRKSAFEIIKKLAKSDALNEN